MECTFIAHDGLSCLQWFDFRVVFSASRFVNANELWHIKACAHDQKYKRMKINSDSRQQFISLVALLRRMPEAISLFSFQQRKQASVIRPY